MPWAASYAEGANLHGWYLDCTPASSSIGAGIGCEARWTDEETALLQLARALADARVPYAIIGGIAMQIHHDEPRTTLDIDVAVRDLDAVLARALTAAGFRRTGRFAHFENWLGPGLTPVQFTDDPDLLEAVLRAVPLALDDVVLHVIGVEDLLHAKLRAAADPALRRSKRLQDLADVQALVEKEPSLAKCLSASERTVLDGGGGVGGGGSSR